MLIREYHSFLACFTCEQATVFQIPITYVLFLSEHVLNTQGAKNLIYSFFGQPINISYKDPLGEQGIIQLVVCQINNLCYRDLLFNIALGSLALM